MVFDTIINTNVSGSTVNSGDGAKIENGSHKKDEILFSNSNLPPRPYIDFVGREKEVKEISQIIELRNTSILSLEGIGGLGKTSIAHYVTEKLLQEDKISFAIWCSAKNKDINENIEDIRQSFSDLNTFLDISLRVLGESSYQLTSEEKKEKLKDLMGQKGNGKVILFILDNFESIKDQELVNYIDSFLSVPGKHFFLFTSRIRSGLKDRPIEILGLSEENLIEIANLYVNHFGIKKISSEDINLLAQKSKGNPLVVRVCIVRMETRKPSEVVRVLDNPNGSKIYEDIANYLFLEIFTSFSNEAKIILYILNYIGNDLNYIGSENKTNKFSDFEIGIIKEVMSDELSILKKDIKDIFDEINQSGLLHMKFDISKNDSIDSIEYEEFLTIFLQKKLEEDIEIQKKLKNFQIQYTTKKNTHSIENQRYGTEAKELGAINENDIICYKECCKAITNINGLKRHETNNAEIFLEQASNFIEIAETFSKDFTYLHYTKGYFYLKEGNFEKSKQCFGKIVDNFGNWESKKKKLFFIKNYIELLVRKTDNNEAYDFILKNKDSIIEGTIKEQIKRSLESLENSYRNQKDFEKSDETKRLRESL